MSTILTGTYTARYASPDFIERAKAQRLALEVQHEGAKVVPDSGTLTLRSGSNASVLNAVVVSIADGIAVYDLLAASVPASESISKGWLEDWTLTFADGQIHTFRRSAHLVARRLYPCVTVGNLTRRHRDLLRLASSSGGYAILQGYLDDAWDEIVHRLIQDGRYPQQIMTPEGLVQAHTALALHRAFADMMLGPGGDGKYGHLFEHYGKTYEDEWPRLRFTLDHDESNTPPASDEEGQAEQPMIQLGGAPVSWGTQ